MSTGVTCSDAALADFNEFKKAGNSLKFIIFKIESGAIVTETSSDNADFGEFLSNIPENDCRYAAYKMDFTTHDGRSATKLVMVTWAPDSAPVKPKMVYAGSKNALATSFTGISVKINATDLSELTEDALTDACRRLT